MSTTSETRPDATPTSAAAPTPAPPRVADPGPLGLAAFALTTFTLSLFNAGLAPESLESLVLPLALFYGGLAQLLAGMWEFRKENTFGATAFVSYGAFWLAFAAFVEFTESGIPEADQSTAVGIFLLGWAVFTGYMLIASLRTTGALIAVFALLFLTFLFLSIGDLLGLDALATAGGYVGLATAIAAWYASFAVVTNTTWGRTVLPVGPR